MKHSILLPCGTLEVNLFCPVVVDIHEVSTGSLKRNQICYHAEVLKDGRLKHGWISLDMLRCIMVDPRQVTNADTIFIHRDNLFF